MLETAVVVELCLAIARRRRNMRPGCWRPARTGKPSVGFRLGPVERPAGRAPQGPAPVPPGRQPALPERSTFTLTRRGARRGSVTSVAYRRGPTTRGRSSTRRLGGRGSGRVRPCACWATPICPTGSRRRACAWRRGRPLLATAARLLRRRRPRAARPGRCNCCRRGWQSQGDSLVVANGGSPRATPTRSACVVCCSMTMSLSGPPGSSKVASWHGSVAPAAPNRRPERGACGRRTLVGEGDGPPRRCSAATTGSTARPLSRRRGRARRLSGGDAGRPRRRLAHFAGRGRSRGRSGAMIPSRSDPGAKPSCYGTWWTAGR